MHDPASELPRIYLPRTPLNKGERRTGALPRGFEALPSG
jgi:hypothetical protein